MAHPLFVYNVRDLEIGHKMVRAPLPAEWLQSLLADTEVRPFGEGVSEAQLTLSKNGADVLVRGKLDLTISVPCARTLDPAVYRLKPEVFLLLSPASPSRSKEGGEPQRKAKPGRVERGGAPKANAKTNVKSGAWAEDPELSEDDAARDTFSGDTVVLDSFLREFILLEIPMVPLREDLRDGSDAATPPPPKTSGPETSGPSREGAETKPLDPRLSPLAELKARLEKKKE